MEEVVVSLKEHSGGKLIRTFAAMVQGAVAENKTI